MKNSHEDPVVDGQNHSPIVSTPRDLQSVEADASAAFPVFTGATSFQGQFCEQGKTHCGHSNMEQDSEQLCGWGALRPRGLQIFNTARWVLFFLSMASFLQSLTVTGLISVVATSIERRFNLSSSQTGLIVSCFDIASCLCLPFVSYFGGNGHKPRWLGWGIGIMGLGSFVFALPHFTTPSYQVTEPESSDLCSSNSTEFSLNRASDGLSNYFYVFMLGQFLHGCGATPLMTLGFTFLDDNVKSNDSPVYIGLFYTATTVGPAVGMLLGAYFLRLYAEITIETELTPASPLWVGNWWLGFIVTGTLSLPVAFAILAYPKQLPGTQETADSCQTNAHQNKDKSHISISNLQFGKAFKDMLRSLLLLLRIPTFIFLSLSVTTWNGQIAAITAFMVKYFESQFSLTSSEAGVTAGGMVIPLAAGAVLGSFVVKRFLLKCRANIMFCTACALVSLLSNFIFFIQCPTVSMAGVTVPYTSGQLDQHVFEDTVEIQEVNGFLKDVLSAQCNSNCSCDRQLFRPVCGVNNVTYYSPCYAGCTSNLTGTGEVYTDCSCVGNVSWSKEGLAVAGKCGKSCSHQTIFLIIYVIAAFFMGLFLIPPFTATLRCVPEKQKSFALGIQWILVRTLGTIPGPIVFGSLMDQACLLRQTKDQGSCYLYENSQMTYFTLIMCVIYRVFGAGFFILALVFLKVPAESESRDNVAGNRGTHNMNLPQDYTRDTHQTSL